MPNAAICITDCFVNDRGRVVVDAHVGVVGGVNTNMQVEVDFAAAAATMNARIIDAVKAALTADLGVTFSPADQVVLFGGRG